MDGRPPLGSRVGWVVPLRLRPIFLTARGPGLERVKLITTSSELRDHSMLHKSAAFSGVLSHSCPTRRATRSVVLSHKISTSPPAGRANRSSLPVNCTPSQVKKHSGITQRTLLVCSLPTRKEERQGSDLTVCSMGADDPKNPWEKRKDISVMKTIGGCIGEIQGFKAAQKKNRLEVRGLLVPYRTSSLRAKRRPPLSLPFFPFSLLLRFLPSV